MTIPPEPLPLTLPFDKDGRVEIYRQRVEDGWQVFSPFDQYQPPEGAERIISADDVIAVVE